MLGDSFGSVLRCSFMDPCDVDSSNERPLWLIRVDFVVVVQVVSLLALQDSFAG